MLMLRFSKITIPAEVKQINVIILVDVMLKLL